MVLCFCCKYVSIHSVGSVFDLFDTMAWRSNKHEETDAEVLNKPTFGKGSLKVISAAGCLPSTLGYRERVLLGKDPLLRVEIGR